MEKAIINECDICSDALIEGITDYQCVTCDDYKHSCGIIGSGYFFLSICENTLSIYPVFDVDIEDLRVSLEEAKKAIEEYNPDLSVELYYHEGFRFGVDEVYSMSFYWK